MKAVIMAGGLGTRLLPVTWGEIPKGLVQVAGKPILEWQLLDLKENRIREICLVVGPLGTKIEEYFGDGSRLGLEISYYRESSPLGTAGALAALTDFLTEPVFALLLGDVVFQIDFWRLEAAHRRTGAVITLFAHPNSHPADSDLLEVQGSLVTGITSKHEARSGDYRNLVNAGIYLISGAVPQALRAGEPLDLEKDVIMPRLAAGEVHAYISTEYVKDAGTPERLEQVQRDLSSGLVARRSLRYPQKCVFLDRDGTINREKGLIASPEALELEEGAGEALRLLNSSDYLTILVTNQPVVARGLCTEAELAGIHRRLETLLGREGAWLDDIRYCPHHPDKGYAEENSAYKIACDCRKPGVGMVMRSVVRHNIDLAESWFVGDSRRDVQTAKNAGLRSILVETGRAGSDEGFAGAEPDVICANLLAAVWHIL